MKTMSLSTTPEFRDLMLNYMSPQTAEEISWEQSIRTQTEELLLAHGRNPIYDSGISEELIQRALEARESTATGNAKTGKWLPGFFGSHDTRLAKIARLHDFLERTPLRRIKVPFEGHEISIRSALPVLEQEVRESARAILGGWTVSAIETSMNDCDLIFGSSAWTPKVLQSEGRPWAYAISPEGLSPEMAIAEGRFHPMVLTERQKLQVEGILSYVQSHVLSRPMLTQQG